MFSRKKSKPRCADCRFAELHPVQAEDGRTLVACHFNPPQIVVVADGLRSQFPILDPEMKCGQFQQK